MNSGAGKTGSGSCNFWVQVEARLGFRFGQDLNLGSSRTWVQVKARLGFRLRQDLGSG